jgi:hypothetical protein
MRQLFGLILDQILGSLVAFFCYSILYVAEEVLLGGDRNQELDIWKLTSWR